MVPRAGLEPAQSKDRRILSPLRLPIPPSRQIMTILSLISLFKIGQLITTCILEAAPGFEPGMGDLQSPALPLGYAAFLLST